MDSKRLSEKGKCYFVIMLLIVMMKKKMMLIFQLYTELPSGNLSPGSEICGCQDGGQLKCTMLEEVIFLFYYILCPTPTYERPMKE